MSNNAFNSYNVCVQNKEEIIRRFSKALKLLREKHDLTQEELAEKSDISYKNIQYLEAQNPTCPSLVTLHKLAKAFNSSLSGLFKKLKL